MSILFPYFELAASLFILLLCFQIFTRHYENKVARFYALFAMVAFLAAIFEYSLRIAFTLEFARDINRIAASLWAFVFPMFAHFSFVFAKKDNFTNNPLSRLFFYLPPALLSLLFLFTDAMYTRYEIWSIGIVSQPSPIYWIFAAHSVFYTLLGIIVFLRLGVSSPQKFERAQALLIALGTLVPFLIATTTDEFMPLLLGVRTIVPTCVFAIAVMNLCIYIAMRNYSLFAVSPAIAADVIIETMPDALLATDVEGKVLFVNDEAARLLSCPSDDLTGKSFASLFKERGKYDKLHAGVVQKRKEILRFEADLIDPLGQRIPALINANLLKDKVVGDTIGIIFVVRDIRG